MTLSQLICDLPDKDLWQYLKEASKPIIMYGMGNGADKIIERLDAFGVAVDDFFASDGFVRGQYFHGKKVLSLADIKEKYDDFIILVSFGSEREDVVGTIARLASEYELYLPDVPVAGEGVFDRAYFDKNIDAIKAAYGLLADELSREVYCDVLAYKLTGKIEYLLEHTQSDIDVYKTVFDTQKWTRTADLGAYNGDSAAFLAGIEPGVRQIIALEPDRKNFSKLLRTAEMLECDIEAHNVCAWSEKTTLYFDRGGNRNSSVSTIGHTASVGDTKKVPVDAETLDNIICGRQTDFIKYDVEGSELEALKGSVRTIEASKPDMLVSGYHRNEDIFALTLELHRLLPEHKLYIRRKRCLPAWEISICAVKDRIN
ncbi:MAG: FkbM family methyltransferase [Clostridia bacterium]|nr:FkbM family methyltransferase [Clostridia bacterium]